MKHLLLLITVLFTLGCFAQNNLDATLTDDTTVKVKNTGTQTFTLTTNDSISISLKKGVKAIDDSSQITFLNGANFDFSPNSNIGYVGIINVFAPDLESIRSLFLKKANPAFFEGDTKWKKLLRWGLSDGKNKDGKLGFNCGIMKINYVTDSLKKTMPVVQNVLINPLDSVKVGNKYLQQYNKVTTISKNSTYSIYFQPMLRLTSNNAHKIAVFFHYHQEFLINRWTTTITSENIQQDSLTIQKNTNTSGFLATKPNTTETTISSTISNYYGVGFTFLFRPITNLTFMLQPTWGYVTGFYGAPTPNAAGNLETFFLPTRTDFYLTKAYLKYKISTSIEAVIGAEIRGEIIGKYAHTPLYATYFGANLGLDAIAKLFK
jgi:hypothetical protein